MDLVRIIFKGKTRDIYNSVDLKTFEKIYKPKGWQMADERSVNESNKIIRELKTETKIKNYIKMQMKQEKQFDDGLFKKGGE